MTVQPPASMLRPDRDLAPLTGGFITPAASVERAISELRHARPVILRRDETALAVMALDAISPAAFARFGTAFAQRHRLYLTAERATRLGRTTEGGLSLPLEGMGFDRAAELSWSAGADLSAAPAEPATALMRRAGQLAIEGLLLPAMICADPADAAPGALEGCLNVDCDALDAAEGARQQFEIVARTPVPLEGLGFCDFVVFRGGLAQKDQVAIVVGQPDLSKPVPVRIHSSCLTGDLCGSLKCDCGDQLRNGLAALAEAGGGVLVYLDQEGRGTGIGAKMRAYGYQHRGYDTIDADAELGLGPDHRRYEAAVSMLGLLGIRAVALLTNNPTKMAALRRQGMDVTSRIAVTGRVTQENRNYLRVKSARAGHMLESLSLQQEP